MGKQIDELIFVFFGKALRRIFPPKSVRPKLAIAPASLSRDRRIKALGQGSATPGMRAKMGTPESSACQAKRVHAQANFKLLRFNKFTFDFVSDF